MIEQLITLLIYLVVLGVLVGLAFYLLELIPFIPANFKLAIRAILICIVFLIVLVLALRILGNMNLPRLS